MHQNLYTSETVYSTHLIGKIRIRITPLTYYISELFLYSTKNSLLTNVVL